MHTEPHHKYKEKVLSPPVDSGLSSAPLRGEVFSLEQMDNFGEALANTHKLNKNRKQNHLLNRLINNEVTLHGAQKILTDSVKRRHRVSMAAEWLIDNFYLIEEHIRNAKTHFNKTYEEDLPQLLESTSPGQTRIYEIVVKVISHTDGRVDMESLSRFIKAYQTVTYLQLAELWAIPFMLRLALIENIRRISDQIIAANTDKNRADYWAKRMIESAGKDAENLLMVMAEMSRSSPSMGSAFATELLQRLQAQGPVMALSLNWIEQQLSERGLTPTELEYAEDHKQDVNQASMGNSIGGLRLLGTMEWSDFVEKHSIVEQILREDNGGIYGLMDFPTCNNYRNVVAHIAKESKLAEHEVARIAIQLLHENENTNDKKGYASHVGYYLIGEGVSQTKKRSKMPVPLLEKIRLVAQKHSFPLYIGSILFVSLAVAAWLVIREQSNINSSWLLLSMVFFSLIGGSHLALFVVNFFSALMVKPDLLPRMDFSYEIPAEFGTLIVIPAMLIDSKNIEKLIQSLEVHYLGNRYANLRFGLVTDFKDAAQESLPEDQALLDLVQRKILELNIKYKRVKSDLFFLFHRPRQWNTQDKIWMGYERKRGKLFELNSLLCGSLAERFTLIIGDQSIFPYIKYVITLDDDTQLPPDAAWKLIATMAHPLNQPLFSEEKKRVTNGYAILQPQMEVSLPEKTASLYARMHGNEPGIDPYTQASSNIYQDLFNEGSFAGKGIYDVDVFNKVLDGKLSNKGILSHDLLEGCHLRSGLVSDVHLYEKYPSSYLADRTRHLRWLRGDWQIASWALPLVRVQSKRWIENPISILSRWKILDNLRRSLVPAALTFLLILGWIALPHSLFCTIVVSSIIAVPVMITSVWDTLRKPKEVIIMHHLKNSIHRIGQIFVKTLFKLSILPYEACSNVIVIGRTVWRMIISRKKLLEWAPSITKETARQEKLLTYYFFMWTELGLAFSVTIYLAIYTAHSLIIAGPILLLWLIAPAITWRVSKPMAKPRSKLSKEQNIFLRTLARKTWSYFERFVQPQDNWLPPDNFQEQPVVLIAHRTSPTNIGLSLLANVSAHDFGYLTTGQLIERTTNSLNTLTKMERYKGHFYNWYNTESLNPLFPKYISTVDSGNLASHLLVLRQAMLALPKQKISIQKIFEGLYDTLCVLVDTLDEKDRVLLAPFKIDLEAACLKDVITPYEGNRHIDQLAKTFATISETLSVDPKSEAYWWKQQLQSQLKQATEDIEIFAPWIFLQTEPQKPSSFISLNANSTLLELVNTARELKAECHKYANNTPPSESGWLELLQSSLTKSISKAEAQINAATHLAQQCQELADMEWNFLYDKSNNLFTIGFNVQEDKMDASFYDLLASEVRLCIYACIAQGKLPEESWFALRRLLTNMHGYPVLLSWSGSMFEYLMPLLVMPTYENTFLDQTYKSLIRCQIIYGQQAGMPWGISESGFNMINANSQYQYRAFGYPGLGVKRGIDEDAVIAPYASALALMVAPEKACENLELLSQKGFVGRYGFYEAIDYTPSRLQRGQSNAIVYSFMAHHQGMSLLSMSYLLHDKPMQKRFESEPQFASRLLLLQEAIPKATTFFAHITDIADTNYVASGTENRVFNSPDTRLPEVQLLSNGKYHVMVTNAGAGYSRWKDLAVTRWREDATRDNWGMFCYVRDFNSDTYWSATHQPTLKKGEKYEATFSLGRADFFTCHNEIEAQTTIVVSPEDDIEMRRVIITNGAAYTKTIEVTSYAEVVIALQSSDLTPAFSNLFVQTEIIEPRHAIICRRRQRAEEELPLLFHLMTIDGKVPDEISYQTDRMEFIGRGNTAINPQALRNEGPLSGKQSSVLDPIVSIRYKVTLDPNETITIDMFLGVSETRESCLKLIEKCHSKYHNDNLFALAWTHSQVVISQINASEADAQLYAHLASSILSINSSFRAAPQILLANNKGQSGLWSYAISGDLPIVLLKIEKRTGIKLAKQLIQAYTYWRLHGLLVDLVIWNEEGVNYRQDLQNEIEALVPAERLEGKGGGVFLRAADQISEEDKILFEAVARINISDAGGTLAEQIERQPIAKVVIDYITPVLSYKPSITSIEQPKDLIFFNGLGGFSPDGNEYNIIIDDENKTPVPWVNVIANPNFGTVISDSGSAYSWVENAHELRLTPWNNDPVSDLGGEAFYLRDEESGHFWSATLLPAGGNSTYVTRHGFGYSVFEHIEDGIYSEMTVFVDIESTIKIIVLKIRNQSGRARKLSATGYTEWVLGTNRMKTAMHIHSEVDPNSGALFAKNPYNTEFLNQVAFFDVDDITNRTFTGDRTEFIGRNGTLQNPDALSRIKLSGRIGLALDPCAAIQVPFYIEDGEEKEIIFRLGAGKDSSDATKIVQQFRGTVAAHESLEKVNNFWKYTLGELKVETTDVAINLITNGWLTYQTLSSRLWGRSGFYQSGGAFGFRDQLQDVLSLLHAAPRLARKQILLCASRQFKEGDVQHWWHPPVGRGVRTRISDDFLWLPFVTSHYILHTGDEEILQETIPFLEGRMLNSGEESYFDLPVISSSSASLYEHCVRAIKHAFKYGEHGLPLIGTGDWNDGYDKVGNKGKGESVWMGFFLYDILIRFSKTSLLNNDSIFADECIEQAQQLKNNIEKNAWDGQWYKRAWFDNGTPLGSSINEECKIDSIAQSWSVLSEAGDSNCVNTAMESAYQHLVQKDVGIIKLLEPAFDKSALNPGYIKGYVPGIRENGGQYTHAAIWLIMAFAKLGDNKRVWELLKMVNPINHGNTPDTIATYKVEPYVLAADVYAGDQHPGRGGWTWYTGSAGWLYRLIIESFLGFQQEGKKLKVNPCIPDEWESFKVRYRYLGSIYHIEVTQKDDVEKMMITVDDVKQDENAIRLIDDGQEHHVQILLGKDLNV